ncbi:DinB family protein [Stieleria maiorica]|uniref:DinB family protein n=1 Tax=Stieleria maiorica TaxID=2795974 RepID=A0A5B9MF91_9BACT|nr:DinB family protein [Stieleria maiorica]QEF98274.1 DinB family protein [Stieleria maiorica]
MSAAELIRRLHQHRMWANGRLIEAADAVSEHALRQPFAIGQGSIWKTLTHLYAAEYVWLAALQGDAQPVAPGDLAGKLPGNQEGDDAATTLQELQSRWSELDGLWRSYLAQLTDEELDQRVEKVASLSGKRSAIRRADILLHVCTHAQYTTAQLINMLRQAGHTDLPDVMLISMARAESL